MSALLSATSTRGCPIPADSLVLADISSTGASIIASNIASVSSTQLSLSLPER
jgi:hypothetical protein